MELGSSPRPRPVGPSPKTRARRAIAAAAALAVLVGLGVVAAPSAQAAWGAVGQWDKAVVRGCQVTTPDGELRLRMKLDNTRSGVTHRATVVRRTGGGTITALTLKASPGSVSEVAVVTWRKNWSGSITIHRPSGEAGGDGLYLELFPRC